jgi:hypothetical protein
MNQFYPPRGGSRDRRARGRSHRQPPRRARAAHRCIRRHGRRHDAARARRRNRQLPPRRAAGDARRSPLRRPPVPRVKRPGWLSGRRARHGSRARMPRQLPSAARSHQGRTTLSKVAARGYWRHPRNRTIRQSRMNRPLLTFMVRRGSTVRVRQRLQEAAANEWFLVLARRRMRRHEVAPGRIRRHERPTPSLAKRVRRRESVGT